MCSHAVSHAVSAASTRFDVRSSLNNYLTRVFTFSPGVSHWELTQAAKVASDAENAENADEAGAAEVVGGASLDMADAGMIVEPAAFEFWAALLFVDISGFTPLCALVDVDAVQAHINKYFTQLIEVILECGGDVIRFAGDAILCAWSLPNTCSDASKNAVSRAAASCALKLVNGGNYYIKHSEITLSIRAGVGCGGVTGMRVGTSERWEFILTGDPMKQVALRPDTPPTPMHSAPKPLPASTLGRA